MSGPPPPRPPQRLPGNERVNVLFAFAFIYSDSLYVFIIAITLFC